MTWGTVATAAAIGAATGAGSAAIQGKDTDEILEGAVIGGATGALTGGVGSEIGTELGKEVGKEALKEGVSTVTQEAGKEALKEGASTVTKEAGKEALKEGIKTGATDTIASAGPQAMQENAANAGILQAGTTPAGATPAAGTIPPPPSPPPAGAVPSPSNAAGIDYNAGLAEAPPGTSGILEVSPDFVPTDDFLGSVPEPAGVSPSPDQMNSYTGTAEGPQTYADMPEYREAFTAKDSVGYKDEAELLNAPETNSFVDGVKSIGEFASNNKFYTGAGLYLGASALGMFNPKAGSGAPPQKKTFRNPNPLSADFNRNAQTTPNVYQPRTYQEGGITQASRQNNDTEGDINGDVPRYYRGELATSSGQRGDVYGATQRFLDMYDPAPKYTPPPEMSSVGIFRDSNPSTASKSAPEAAEIRRKAIENRSYVKTGANYMPASREMGELDFTIIGSKDKKNRGSDSDSVLAARGGIMQANLGGYATGGNPRLLSGPGDGMSDNIPAMIGTKQPARLADGEFVVPADVVSHLGNGSTAAGAKRLHEMMNQVRMDRTGKKKQAPAVKAKKYIPK